MIPFILLAPICFCLEYRVFRYSIGDFDHFGLVNLALMDGNGFLTAFFFFSKGEIEFIKICEIWLLTCVSDLVSTLYDHSEGDDGINWSKKAVVMLMFFVYNTVVWSFIKINAVTAETYIIYLVLKHSETNQPSIISMLRIRFFNILFSVVMHVWNRILLFFHIEPPRYFKTYE